MKKYFKYIKTVLTIAILFLFLLYVIKNPEILTSLQSLNPIFIVVVMLLFLIVFLLEGLFIKITLQAFDKKISIKESFYISTISRIGNYLLPMRAGAIFRATYLKNKYDFKYSKFLSTLYGYYIILFLLYALLGIAVMGIKSFVFNESYLIMFWFFFFLFIAMLILMYVRIPIKKDIENKNKVIKFISKFTQSWDRIVKDKKLLRQLIFITLGNIVFNTVIIYFEFIALNIHIDFLNLILYSCLSGVSLLISLTPGSLGIREAVFLLSSKSLSLVEEQIMQLAIVDRGIMFILLVLLIFVISIFLKEFNLKDVFFAKKKN